MKRVFILFLFLLSTLSGIADAAEITSKEQLNHFSRTVGVSQGSIDEDIVKRELPESSIVYYSDNYMGYVAVAAGKIDAYIYDRQQMALTIESGFQGVRLLDEPMDEKVKIAVGISSISKIPDLEDKINTFITEIRADGTLDDMYQRWVLEQSEEMTEIELPSSP